MKDEILQEPKQAIESLESLTTFVRDMLFNLRAHEVVTSVNIRQMSPGRFYVSVTSKKSMLVSE